MSPRPPTARPLVRAPQDLLAGIVVILVGALVLRALGRISTTSYQAFSPALFPRLCTWATIAGGLVLVARGFLRDGPPLRPIPLRPVVLVTASVVVFGLVAPVLGYAPAGLLTVLVAGLATPEARPLELAAMAVVLVGLSVALFSLLLKLSIPVLILP